MVQVLTEHSHFNFQKHKVGLSHAMEYRKCASDDETSLHVLFQCSAPAGVYNKWTKQTNKGITDTLTKERLPGIIAFIKAMPYLPESCFTFFCISIYLRLYKRTLVPLFNF